MKFMGPWTPQAGLTVSGHAKAGQWCKVAWPLGAEGFLSFPEPQNCHVGALIATVDGQNPA